MSPIVFHIVIRTVTKLFFVSWPSIVRQPMYCVHGLFNVGSVATVIGQHPYITSQATVCSTIWKSSRWRNIQNDLFDKEFSHNILRSTDCRRVMNRSFFWNVFNFSVIAHGAVLCSEDYRYAYVVQYISEHVGVFAVHLIFNSWLVETLDATFQIVRVMVASLCATSTDQ